VTSEFIPELGQSEVGLLMESAKIVILEVDQYDGSSSFG
jgi:hypothetical protein